MQAASGVEDELATLQEQVAKVEAEVGGRWVV